MTADVEFVGPNWEPLLSVLPEAAMGDWMWMSRLTVDGKVIEQYKHSDTRRYVNLDHAGQAFSVQYDGRGDAPTVHKVAFADAYRTAAGGFAHPLT